MRDTLATLFRATPGRVARRVAATLLAIACGLGGCAGGGAPAASLAMAGSGATVAFESIDGPPPPVFERMVNVLDSESKLRNLSDRLPRGRGRLPGAQLSRRPGQPRPHHHRLGLGRLRPRPATRAAAFRRGTGRQGRTRRLGRGRRSDLAENRAGRPDRPLRHDQRNGAGGTRRLPAPALRGPAVASAPAPVSHGFAVSRHARSAAIAPWVTATINEKGPGT